MINNNITEFLKQINNKIEWKEKYLRDVKEKLIDYTNSFSSHDNFGLAKYAELVTVYQAELSILQEQKKTFEFLFIEVTESNK